ncbi:alpha/beta hydrolase family protein [Qipengyuania marisflavi]|uniref:S9 family peptidase n=1 Tax=Qipengyuania marisflavi TaxID=2486356 RepID=A0A5S3P2T8_9SPHN|nr:prolyl oligopeptidase family serine peptidase [Qipengyuania marisflavi]TMM47181.1 S9 family peptidase [Qipengyuania marisflavi]
MRLKKYPFLMAVACALAATTNPLAAQTAGTPSIPVEVWALRDVISTADLSPDGKHLLILKTESKMGENVLELYETANLTKPIARLAADPMEIVSARFVSDKFIYGTAWQVSRKSVKGPEQDVRSYKSYSYNLETGKFSKTQPSADERSYDIVNVLPGEPDSVLVAAATSNDGGSGVDPYAAFRPRSYYRYNLNTGGRELVIRGSTQYANISFDDEGNPRFATGFEAGTKEQVYYYRAPGDSTWKEFGDRFDLDDHANLYRVLGGFQGLVGFKQGDPNTGYVIDNRGEDKAALWEFDFTSGQFGRKLFSAPDADVMGITENSMRWAGDNTLAAAVYPGAKMERHWFDPQEKQLYELLESAIPNAHSVNIRTRSRDGKSMVISNSGPHDPGSFWLFLDGKLAKIGSRNPLLKADDLADVEFIKYPARDGRMIPAYVTKPKGQGPFPLVVLPHGGPHVNEVVGFDEWGQLLANAGYMVLQPQYRMSVGWGQDHFDSAYGQHGLAMQDDKDDGALYLVKQGLVDKDRMAMFGWSYGGYAALVATTRDPQIYQCAIAGAAVADPEKGYIQTRNPNGAKALDDWGKRRGTIGINPINEVAKSNIPLLMVHGDVDRRVLYYNYEDYEKAMQKAGKTNAQFLTLKGADHFSNTLNYEHQETFYTKMLDFLKNDCGPGGL